MNKTRAKYLLERYYSNQLTPEERAEFVLLLHHSKFEQLRSEWLDELWPTEEEQWEIPPNEKLILEELTQTFKSSKRRRYYIKYGSVAVALVVSFVALMWKDNSFMSYFQNERDAITTLKVKEVTLRFADGQEVPLDTVQGTIILDKELIYADGRPVLDSTLFADQLVTLSVPAKKTYNVQLSDGTRVKLNSQTSLTFPRYFPSNERRVTLEGEGYFEVEEDKSKPFFVNTISKNKPMSVQVTGTKFNVSAYSSDPVNSVSLVEGQVIVNDYQLSPNRAFYINKDGDFIRGFDASSTLAWINHEFRFERESLYSMLRKLEQWYGVKFQIEASNEKVSIGGAVSKDKELGTILEILEAYCDVRFSDLNGVIQVKEK